jgi:hypothetical protein
MYSGPLVYSGLIYANLKMFWFSSKRHSQPLTEEELEDLAVQLTQKQQQEQEEPILRSVETYDLKEILAGIDTYLQRLGNVDPDWERSCSIRRSVIALLQPYYHVLQERTHQARQTTLLSYFKNKSEEQPVDPKTAEGDPIDRQSTVRAILSSSLVVVVVVVVVVVFIVKFHRSNLGYKYA